MKERRVMQKKSFLATLLLSFFLGPFGIHRFYTGYVGIGVAQLFTLGGLGIWVLIDLISICLDKYKDAKGQKLDGYNSKIGYAVIIFIVLSFILKFLPALFRG